MKILQINAVHKILSTGRICKELSDYFVDCGNECIVAYGQGEVPTTTHEFFIGTLLDHKIHALCSRISGKQGYFSFLATKKLLKFMDEYKPDTVILHNLHGNYINVPMLLEYLAKNNIATVLFLHDCWFFTGKCCYYPHNNCNKWQTGCGNCPSLLEDNVSWFFDTTASIWKDKKMLFDKNNHLGIIGVSNWITEDAKKSPILSNAKIIERVYNSIDFNKFYFDEDVAKNLREQYGLQNKKILLTVATNWNERKGINDLIKLSQMISEDEQIVCIGQQLGLTALPDNIISIEKTDNIDILRGWYSAANVFINLSKEETFGLVSAEALSCGTPIVCFNATANPELVGENCGIVCTEDSIENFYDCIKKVLVKEKSSYRDSCITFAKENFSKDKNFKAIYELILNL